MDEYLNKFVEEFSSYANYVWKEISFQVSPWYVNYFWWLIFISLLVWGLEILFPWRKNQKILRKDFGLDVFYMFFNFFIFKIIFFAGLSAVTSMGFEKLIGGASSLALFNGASLAYWAQVILFFVVLDFVQWLVHLSLHRFNFLWQFHKVHHSVEQMGFAAHLRYHWMEAVFYTPVKYLAILLIGGFQPESVFIIYYINITIGHLNHANIKLNYGPLKYIINNPVMHIWHHAYTLPSNHKHGMNYGISLSIWDYVFKTNYLPYSGRDIRLGFQDIKTFPKTFWRQIVYPIFNKH